MNSQMQLLTLDELPVIETVVAPPKSKPKPKLTDEYFSKHHVWASHMQIWLAQSIRHCAMYGELTGNVEQAEQAKQLLVAMREEWKRDWLR
jgi:hypothetical protein